MGQLYKNVKLLSAIAYKSKMRNISYLESSSHTARVYSEVYNDFNNAYDGVLQYIYPYKITLPLLDASATV